MNTQNQELIKFEMMEASRGEYLEMNPQTSPAILRIRPDACLRVFLHLIGEGALTQNNIEKVAEAALNYELLEQLDGRTPNRGQVREYLQRYLSNGLDSCTSGQREELNR